MQYSLHAQAKNGEKRGDRNMQDIGRQKEIKELLAETDRRIEELRAVLADMDEIAALRRRRGEPESDDYNGFRRSDVLELLGQQQESRAALVAGLQQSAEEVPKERTSLSAALEKLYEALSADVGRARRDVLQELKFYSRQTSAAYDELSLVIDALADRVAERVIERLGGTAFLAALPAAADAAQGEEGDAARGEESALPANSPEEISEEESASEDISEEESASEDISERESASEDISERESTSENISEEENASEDISEQAPAAGEEEGAPSEAPQVTASEQAIAETAEAPAEEAPAESSGEESTKAPAETAAVAEEAPAQEAGAESTEAPAETAETAEEDPAAQGEEGGGAQIREEEPAGPQGSAPEEK